MVCIIKISPELNTDFECPHPWLEFWHKSKQVFTTQTSCFFVLLYDYRSTSNSCRHNLSFLSHIVDRKTENYKKIICCKIPSEYKKKDQFRNGAFLFAFSIYIHTSLLGKSKYMCVSGFCSEKKSYGQSALSFYLFLKSYVGFMETVSDLGHMPIYLLIFTVNC